MKEQKCPNCKTWNTNAIRCEKCDTALVSEEVNKDYAAKIAEEDEAKEPSKFYLFTQKMKNSKNILVKATYYFFFSLWSIYMFILGIILFLVAGTPG